jgi:DNA-directed RNA polymerase subunit H (RpoH/RPB5)
MLSDRMVGQSEYEDRLTAKDDATGTRGTDADPSVPGESGNAAGNAAGRPDALPGANVVRASSLGDVEVRALIEEFPTFSVVVVPGLSVVFHTAHSTVKKQEVFYAAETSALAGSTPHVILVLRNKNTATVKSLMAEASARKARMEIFSIQELQYNPARHVLVPKHNKVPKPSEEGVLRTYAVANRFQLPLILQGDVMARYLGLQHGDIVRIERPSPTAGIAVVYRVCM